MIEHIRKKYIFIFVIIINIFYFININSVSAKIWGDGVAPAPCPSCTFGGGNSGVYDTQNMIGTAYRISITGPNGQKINGNVHSVDYWPKSDEGYLQYNSDHDYICKTGFQYFTNYCSTRTDANGRMIWAGRARSAKPNWLYVEPKAAKTENVSRSLVENQLLSIGKYNQYDFIVSKKYPNKVWVNDNPSPGDTEYNNNYTKALLEILYDIIDKDSSKITDAEFEIIAKLYLNSGYGVNIPADKNHITKEEYRKIVYTAAKDKAYIAVEPIMAMHNNSTNRAYIGTSYEMATILNYTSRQGLQWAYPRYSYLHPIVYTYSPKGEKIAGVNACTKITSTSENVDIINHLNAGNKSHCLGIFILDVPGAIDDPCPINVKNYFNQFKSGKISKSQYNTAVSKVCDSAIGSDKCSWLYIDNAPKYDIDLSKTLASCEKPSCESVTSSKVGKTVSAAARDKVTTDIKKLYSEKFKKTDVSYGIDAWNVFGTAQTSYCTVLDCPETLEVYKKKGLTKSILDNLYKLFSKYNNLNYSVLAALYGDDEELIFEGASCESTPACYVKPTVASCDKDKNASSFTIKDATIDTLYSTTEEIDMDVEKFASLTVAGKKSCLNKHVAYNMYNDGTSEYGLTEQGSIETSEYGSSTKPATCWEEVTFSFPKRVGNDGESIIAGNLFRWGLDGDFEDTESNKFGRMRIRRLCTITKYAGKSEARIGSNWANVIDGKPLLGTDPENDGESSYAVSSSTYNATARVNPNIKLNYVQALPSLTAKERASYQSVSANLKVEISSVRQKVYERQSDGTIGKIIDNEDYIDYTADACNYDKKPSNTLKQCMDGINAGNHPRRTVVRKKDKPNFFIYGGVIEVIADYDIVYTDDFKWYSDMSDNFKKKTSTEVQSEINKLGGSDIKEYSQYVSLGYGLPTSFVTPTKKLTGVSNYGYDLTNTTGNGALYVTVNQIGTQGNGKNYHFDNLINKTIQDDDTIGISNSIVYSCDFSIKNLLYNYECPNDDCTKKCTAGSAGCKETYTCPGGICTPKDIDVVFRTVSLSKFSSKFKGEGEDYDSYKAKFHESFPGRSGKKERQVGINWRKIWQYEFDESYFIEFLNANVYDYSPRYVIDLDSKLIQEIRDTNSHDSYTSMENYKYGYFYFGVPDAVDASRFLGECDDVTGSSDACGKANVALSFYAKASSGADIPTDISETYAASEFLTDLIKKKKLTGGCTKDDTGLLTDTQKRAEKYAKTMGC